MDKLYIIDDITNEKYYTSFTHNDKKIRREQSYKKLGKDIAVELIKDKVKVLGYECEFEVCERIPKKEKDSQAALNFAIASATGSSALTLNENQLKFACSPIENSVLLGNPGCGKTKTIIEYCIHKLENGLITDGKNFIILSFSKKAQLDFVARGKRSTHPKLFNPKNIRTLHSLAMLISKTLFLKSSSSLNTIEFPETLHLWPLAFIFSVIVSIEECTDFIA